MAIEEMSELLLISPYWNVNLSVFEITTPSIKLLISPYWNVNFICFKIAIGLFFLLISPYWNVNCKLHGIY